MARRRCAAGGRLESVFMAGKAASVPSTASASRTRPARDALPSSVDTDWASSGTWMRRTAHVVWPAARIHRLFACPKSVPCESLPGMC